MAATEHVEVHLRGIDAGAVVTDRNTSYRQSLKWAGNDLIIIPGAEITRGMPPGHLNALFLKDANLLAVDPLTTPLSTPAERERYYASPAARERFVKEMEIAHAQGAFVIWNHPGSIDGAPDGKVHPSQLILDMINRGWLQGVEVANGTKIFDGAMQLALDKSLAIIGSSDTHGLVQWDYAPGGVNGNPNIGGPHRTSTLVLATSNDIEGIRKAVFDRATVALVANTLYGRPAELLPIIRASITMRRRGHYQVRGKKQEVYQVSLRNDAPIPFLLRTADNTAFYNSGPLLPLPAHTEILLGIDGVATAGEFKSITFEILNAYVAQRSNLTVDIAPEACTECPETASGGDADVLAVPNGTPLPPGR